MIIKELTAESLQAFIESDAYARLPEIPISRHRAVSQIHNPRLQPDDSILFLAYDDEKLIGYLGVLPDYYFVGNEQYRAGWLSCFWVDPAQRGKGISVALGSAAVEKWKNKLFATEFTLASKKLWLRINALEVAGVREGMRYYLRFNLAEILPRKKPAFEKMKGILRIADKILNILNKPRINKFNGGQDLWKVTRLNRADGENAKFIEQHQQEELFKRGPSDINWILEFPWILPTGQAEKVPGNYYFSAMDHRIEFRLLKIASPDDKTGAILFLMLRNEDMKVPYIWMDADAAKAVADILFKIMKAENIARLSTCHKALNEAFNHNKYPFIHARKWVREYLASPFIAKMLPEYLQEIVQDGDGDGVFT